MLVAEAEKNCFVRRGRLKRLKLGCAVQIAHSSLKAGDCPLDSTIGGKLGLIACFLGIKLIDRLPLDLHQLCDDTVNVKVR